MKVSGPITTLHSLTFQPATAVKLGSAEFAHTGPAAAVYATWLEKPGAKETSTSELWKPLAHNMWQATALKK